MFVSIINSEFNSLLSYKTIRLNKNRLLENRNDLLIFSRSPNTKISDKNDQIILELSPHFSSKNYNQDYFNDSDIARITVDDVSYIHLINDDENLRELIIKHKLPLEIGEFKSLWNKWTEIETARACHEYAKFVTEKILGEIFNDADILKSIVLSNFSFSQNCISSNSSYINLCKNKNSLIDSAREYINQSQYALLELPLLYIEQSLGIDINFDELETTAIHLYPRLTSERLKNQKFYGRIFIDSDLRNLLNHLKKNYPNAFDKSLSPLGVNTYLISCDQIYTKTFNIYDFQKNIKELSISENPTEAFVISFMIAVQYFIKNII